MINSSKYKVYYKLLCFSVVLFTFPSIAYAIPVAASVFAYSSLGTYLISLIIFSLGTIVTFIKTPRLTKSSAVLATILILVAGIQIGKYFEHDDQRRKDLYKLYFRGDLNRESFEIETLKQVDNWFNKDPHLKFLEADSINLLNFNKTIFLDLSPTLLGYNSRIPVLFNSSGEIQATHIFASSLINYLESLNKNLNSSEYDIVFSSLRPFRKELLYSQNNRIIELLSKFRTKYVVANNENIEEGSKILKFHSYHARSKELLPARFTETINFPVRKEYWLFDAAAVTFPNVDKLLDAAETVKIIKSTNIKIIVPFTSLYRSMEHTKQLVETHLGSIWDTYDVGSRIIYYDAVTQSEPEKIGQILNSIGNQPFILLSATKHDWIYFGLNLCYLAWTNSLTNPDNKFNYLGASPWLADVGTELAITANLNSRSYSEILQSFTINQILQPVLTQFTGYINYQIKNIYFALLIVGSIYGLLISFVIRRGFRHWITIYKLLQAGNSKTGVPALLKSNLLRSARKITYANFFLGFLYLVVAIIFSIPAVFAFSDFLPNHINPEYLLLFSILTFAFSLVKPVNKFTLLAVNLVITVFYFNIGCALGFLGIITATAAFLYFSNLWNSGFKFLSAFAPVTSKAKNLEIAGKSIETLFSQHKDLKIQVLPGQILSSKEDLYLNDNLAGANFIVRSCLTSEDQSLCSNAGMGSSVLNVQRSKVLEISRGLFESQSECQQVLIQPLVETTLAGVMFSRAPDNRETLLIEFSDQGCSEICSGLIDTSSFRIGRRTGQIVSANPSVISQEYKIFFERLSIIGFLLESHFQFPVDIEWGYSSTDKVIYIFQVRPITAFTQSVEAHALQLQMLTQITKYNLDRKFCRSILNELGSELSPLSSSIIVEMTRTQRQWPYTYSLSGNLFELESLIPKISLLKPKAREIKWLINMVDEISRQIEKIESEQGSLIAAIYAIERFISDLAPLASPNQIFTNNDVLQLPFYPKFIGNALRSGSYQELQSVFSHRAFKDYELADPSFSEITFEQHSTDYEKSTDPDIYSLEDSHKEILRDQTLRIYRSARGLLLKAAKQIGLSSPQLIFELTFDQLKIVQQKHLLPDEITKFVEINREISSCFSRISQSNAIKVQDLEFLTIAQNLSGISPEIAPDLPQALSVKKIVSGKIKVIDQFSAEYLLQAKNEIKGPTIIVVPYLNPQIVQLFGEIEGIVTRVGSELSHLAILAREMNKPIVRSKVQLEDDEHITIQEDGSIAS